MAKDSQATPKYPNGLQRLASFFPKRTIEDTAEGLGMIRPTYEKKLRGERSLKPHEITKAAKFYAVSENAVIDPLSKEIPNHEISNNGDLPLPKKPPLSPPNRVEIQAVQAPQFSKRMIPVMGLAPGGNGNGVDFHMNGQVIDYTPCPTPLENVPDVFCIYVVGQSMEPRYFEGEKIYLNPHKKPLVDDFVLIECHPTQDGERGNGLIKWFKGISGNKVKVEQFNPPQKFTIPLEKIYKITVIWVDR